MVSILTNRNLGKEKVFSLTGFNSSLKEVKAGTWRQAYLPIHAITSNQVTQHSQGNIAEPTEKCYLMAHLQVYT